MKKYLTINNTTFEVVKSPKVATLLQLEHAFDRGLLSIYSAYERPSCTKVRVWRFWEQELKSMKCIDYCITSYNTFQFTISGHLEYEHKQYFVKITPKHNYLYLIG